MKAIFLDIDGPLVNHRSNAAHGPSTILHVFDPVASAMVLRLCKDHHAKIVISSSWRYDHSAYSLRAILNNAAPGLGDCMHSTSPFTPKINTERSRGHEIAKWLSNQTQEVDAYLILDDSSDFLPDQLEHWVRCDAYDGLDFAGFKAAGHILQNRPVPEGVQRITRAPRCDGVTGALELPQ